MWSTHPVAGTLRVDFIWATTFLMPSRDSLFQYFKYTVYFLLTLNIYVFFAREWAASAFRFSDGIGLGAIIVGFAATIDTAAWVLLLLMFELETYVLEDRHVTRPVRWSIHGLRAISYTVIGYAFYGYLTKLLFLLDATPLANTIDPCSLVGHNWTYAIGLDEYVQLTTTNCASFTNHPHFLQFPGLTAVVDEPDYMHIVRLAWVDVINSGVWIVVVLVLEGDVWLHERKLFIRALHRLSLVLKTLLYSTLLCAAIYWGFKGDFVDFWDAFLWLVAFFFIELNIFAWRKENSADNANTDSPAT